MCSSCCGTQRSDIQFCWKLYEDIFPGSDIEHACRECCGKEIGPPNPPHPQLPKTLKCSAIRPALTCKHCCQNPRSNVNFCNGVYEEFNQRTLREACVSTLGVISTMLGSDCFLTTFYSIIAAWSPKLLAVLCSLLRG